MKNIFIKHLPTIAYLSATIVFFTAIPTKHDLANFITAMVFAMPMFIIAYLVKRYYLYLIKTDNKVIAKCNAYSKLQKTESIKEAEKLQPLLISFCLWVKKYLIIFIYLGFCEELVFFGVKTTALTIIAAIALYITYSMYNAFKRPNL